jgi:hypothetical protein
MVNMYYVPCFVFNVREIYDHFSVQIKPSLTTTLLRPELDSAS